MEGVDLKYAQLKKLGWKWASPNGFEPECYIRPGAPKKGKRKEGEDFWRDLVDANVYWRRQGTCMHWRSLSQCTVKDDVHVGEFCFVPVS